MAITVADGLCDDLAPRQHIPCAKEEVMKGPNGAWKVDGEAGSDFLDFAWYGDLMGYSLDYYSHGGNDRVIGSKYDDRFFLGSGAETIDGRGGQDTAIYTDSPDAVVVALSDSIQHGGWAEGDSLVNVENVTGSSNDDTIIGNDRDNVLIGGGGRDLLQGGRGNDQLFGGSGRDVFGGLLSGADHISGGADKDTFNFMVGRDAFHLYVTDFNPLIWKTNQPSEASIIASSTAELFRLNFDSNSGITTQAQANAAVYFDPLGPDDHDVTAHVVTPFANSTITFVGLGDRMGDNDAITIYQRLADWAV
jgi:Ca2+-binding RTX toxin-like protein